MDEHECEACGSFCDEDDLYKVNGNYVCGECYAEFKEQERVDNADAERDDSLENKLDSLRECKYDKFVDAILIKESKASKIVDEILTPQRQLAKRYRVPANCRTYYKK